MANQDKGKVKFIRKNGKVIPIRGDDSSPPKEKSGSRKKKKWDMREGYRKELLSKKFEPKSKFRISSEYGFAGGVLGAAAGYAGASHSIAKRTAKGGLKVAKGYKKHASLISKVRNKAAIIGGLAGIAAGSIFGGANTNQMNSNARRDFNKEKRSLRRR